MVVVSTPAVAVVALSFSAVVVTAAVSPVVSICVVVKSTIEVVVAALVVVSSELVSKLLRAGAQASTPLLFQGDASKIISSQVDLG